MTFSYDLEAQYTNYEQQSNVENSKIILKQQQQNLWSVCAIERILKCLIVEFSVYFMHELITITHIIKTKQKHVDAEMADDGK